MVYMLSLNVNFARERFGTRCQYLFELLGCGSHGVAAMAEDSRRNSNS